MPASIMPLMRLTESPLESIILLNHIYLLLQTGPLNFNYGNLQL
jgi:hypothetical protein